MGYYRLTRGLNTITRPDDEDENFDNLITEKGIALSDEINRVYTLLFETLFNAQTVFQKTYKPCHNLNPIYLKIAVLSKNEKALEYLSELFSNQLEPQFSNIDVQCCLLPQNSEEDKESIALAIHDKAIVLTDDAFKDHTAKISPKNKDLFNYWKFHSHY